MGEPITLKTENLPTNNIPLIGERSLTMAGSARSLQSSTFVGLRVSRCNYYPAHSKNGVNISQRLVITAGMNTPSRANNGEGRVDFISLTVWGKLADICAKSMSPGKEFNCLADLHTYLGRVFYNQQVLTAQDGTPITTRKVSFTITRLTFGEESNKFIAAEIGAGLRPAGWNAIGTPDYNHWRETLKARSGLAFNPNMPTFGYAQVTIPNGPGIGAFIPGQNAGGNAGVNTDLGQQIEGAVIDAAGKPNTVNTTFMGGDQNQQTVIPQNQAAAGAGVSKDGFLMPADV